MARDAVGEIDDVLSVPSPQVVLKEFGDSAVLLGVRARHFRRALGRSIQTRTAVVGAVKEAFDRENVKIPFPQQELMAREETDGFVLAGRRDDESDAREDASHAPATDGGDDA